MKELYYAGFLDQREYTARRQAVVAVDRFGARPAPAAVLTGDRFRVAHEPDYPLGKDGAEAGRAEQLEAYLSTLTERLDGLRTQAEARAAVQNQLPHGMRVTKRPVTAADEAPPADKIKASAIMAHAKANNVKEMEVLLQHGVAVDYRDEDTGNTPLLVACQAGQRQAIFFLVEHGANVNAQNTYGDTPLHELIKNKRENLAICKAFCGVALGQFRLLMRAPRLLQGLSNTAPTFIWRISASTRPMTWRCRGSKRT